MKMPNRTGTVCKLPGKRRRPYMVRLYTPNGYAILGYYRLRSEAVTALMQAAGKAPPASKSPTATLSEIYEIWSSKKYSEVSSAAARSYKNAWGKITPLHKRPIRYITVSDIEAAVIASDPAVSTRKLISQLLHQLYAYAIAHDLADKDPSAVADISKRPAPETQLVRKPFTYAEVVDLFSSPHPYAAIVLVGIYTGMRPGELLELRISEVDLDTNMLRIAGSKSKSGHSRVIPIHPAILLTITILARNSPDTLLFHTAKGKPVSYFSYHSFMESLGHTPHDTRHTFASIAHKCDMDQLAVKRIMGHFVSDLTQAVYTHLDESFLIRELRKFAVL